MSEFDSLVDDSSATQAPAPNVGDSHQGVSFDSLPDDNEKYGTLGQTAIAGLEGAAQGIAGPVATFAEHGILGVPKADILARQQANPITHGIGEAAGLTAGLMAGTGEAAVMTKAGELATEALGIGNLAKEASWGAKVGSSAVQQAAEMAVLQGSDEASKLLLKDPEASSESAIANIGMAAALGGAGGAFMTGAASPLWQATAGPKVEALLTGLREHLNGVGAVVPEDIAKNIQTLGVEPSPIMRGVFTGKPNATEAFNILKETQNKAVIDSIEGLHKDVSQSVMDSLGIAPEAIEIHSDNEAGHELLDTFKKEYKAKYEPIADAMEKRNQEAAGISIPDSQRLKQYGQLIEQGMNKVGTDSPYYKVYEEFGQRMLAKETIGSLDTLKTEINNRVKGLKIGGDHNIINALNDVKSTLTNFQESQIERAAAESEALGVTGAKKAGQDLLAERKAVNQSYANFANMSDELTNHLGIGGFHGEGSLRSKLTSKIAAEDLLKKFSFRGNSDFIPFLQKNFPDVLAKVKENELKRILKPAILSAKEGPININKLHDTITKGMAGQSEYIQSVIPQNALERIQAAKELLSAVPNMKSSGTAGWMTKVMNKMPQSALSMVAMIGGHNPLIGYLGGEMAQRMGRDIPDAIRLGYLKFLGSGQPIKAEGFKSMVDFFHNTYKGVNLLKNSTANVLKSGAQVLTASQMPSKADTDKLDKFVTKMQTHPHEFEASNSGHVGHYLPEHQVALTKTTASAVQYLQALKPHPTQNSPLDRPIPPTKAQEARYQRALTIAQQPAIVMQHVKNGTLQASDIMDLKSIYPGLYRTMADQLSINLTNKREANEIIPHKTRMGLSLFLGQPLDTSMVPTSIQAAQMTYAPNTPPNAPQSSQTNPRPKPASTALAKGPKAYKTTSQAAEGDRSSRD